MAMTSRACETCGARIIFRPDAHTGRMICLTATPTTWPRAEPDVVYRVLRRGVVWPWSSGTVVPGGSTLHEFHTALPGHGQHRRRDKAQEEALF